MSWIGDRAGLTVLSVDEAFTLADEVWLKLWRAFASQDRTRRWDASDMRSEHFSEP